MIRGKRVRGLLVAFALALSASCSGVNRTLPSAKSHNVLSHSEITFDAIACNIGRLHMGMSAAQTERILGLEGRLGNAGGPPNELMVQYDVEPCVLVVTYVFPDQSREGKLIKAELWDRRDGRLLSLGWKGAPPPATGHFGRATGPATGSSDNK